MNQETNPRDEDSEGAVLTEQVVKTKRPSMYKVVFHNDDFTPMELVTEILMTFFDKSLPEATHIMLTVHKKGQGVAGVYTHELAETKAAQATQFARNHQAPLLITVEAA